MPSPPRPGELFKLKLKYFEVQYSLSLDGFVTIEKTETIYGICIKYEESHDLPWIDSRRISFLELKEGTPAKYREIDLAMYYGSEFYGIKHKD